MSKDCAHDMLESIDGVECPLCQLDGILKFSKNKSAALHQQSIAKIQELLIDLHKRVESQIYINRDISIERDKIEYELQSANNRSESYLSESQIHKTASKKILKHLEHTINICLKTYLTTDKHFMEYFKIYLKHYPQRVVSVKHKIYYLIIFIFRGVITKALGRFTEPIGEKKSIEELRLIQIKRFDTLTEPQIKAAVEHVVDEVADIIRKENSVNEDRFNKIKIDSFFDLHRVGYFLVGMGSCLLLATLAIHILFASGFFHPLNPEWLHLAIIIPSLSCIYFGIRELRRNLSRELETQEEEITKIINEMLERISSIAQKANETADPIIDLGKKIKNLIGAK